MFVQNELNGNRTACPLWKMHHLLLHYQRIKSKSETAKCQQRIQQATPSSLYDKRKNKTMTITETDGFRKEAKRHARLAPEKTSTHKSKPANSFRKRKNPRQGSCYQGDLVLEI
eukprot:Platyproteum_vivax@DN6536_c0_g1_i1.p1